MKGSRVVLRVVSISFSILIALLVIFGIYKGSIYAYEFGYRVFTEESVDKAPGKDVVVLVTDDMSEREIGEMLEEKGLVSDALLFWAQLKLSAYSGELDPGTYTLNTSMTAKDMIVVMAESEEETETEGAGETDAEEGSDTENAGGAEES